MKPAPFEYLRAESIHDCTRALAAGEGQAKILAGGQSLVPVLAMRLARPSLLVDINLVPGLARVERASEDMMHVGALVRHADLVQQTQSPLLAEAARWIGHAAIRSRGTLGGSIAHADPSAELPVVAAALEATITIAGARGVRRTTAEELFVGALEADLAHDEVIVGLELAVPEAWGFAELSRRQGDFGLVTVVTALVRGAWRVAIGGVASVPHRATECESILNGGQLTRERVRDAARAAAAGIDTSSDLHASAGYRRAMAEEFTARSISQAVARSGEQTDTLGVS